MELKQAVKKLVEKLEDSGVKLLVKSEADGTIKIGKIEFRKHKNFSDLTNYDGILLRHSTTELRQQLKIKGISYIDIETADIFLNSDSIKIQINEHKFKKRKQHKKIVSVNTIAPTNIISPNGLALVDLLFRTQNSDLEKFRSTLHFCKTFNIYQPKASQIMTKMNAKNLIDLKEKIKSIPIEWWLFALEFPATKRKMTSFFEVSTEYYSLRESETKTFDPHLQNFFDSTNLNQIVPGPVEVAKTMGEIIDNSICLWVAKDYMGEFQKKYKLIPGRKEGCRTWMLASPRTSIQDEEIITHDEKLLFGLRTNVMRAIWDLGFGDSRLREVRESMLRRFVNEN